MENSLVSLVFVIYIILFQITSTFMFKVEALYDSRDKVTVLNNTNFRDHVFGSQRAWIVEFYSSWCGHCVRFAPTWKKLAEDVTGWNSVISVAAVDCALDVNNPLCREYEVMAYPTVKLFSAGTKEGMQGVKLDGDKSVKQLRMSVVDFLLSEQRAGRGRTWPSLSPYMAGELSSVWNTAGRDVKFTALLFEDALSYTGREVILDMSSDPQIRVERIMSDNKPLVTKFQIQSFPSLVIIGRQHQPVSSVSIQGNTRLALVQALQQFLNYPEEKVSKAKIGTKRDRDEDDEGALPGEETGSEETENERVGAADGEEKATEGEGDTKQQTAVVWGGDHSQVYMHDLELALHYSLFHEVGLHKVVSGDGLAALQAYVTVLSKYFPGRVPVARFLQDTQGWLMNSGGVIHGKDFVQFITELDRQVGAFSATPADWLGCRGSDIMFRGYPCGLWMLFHTLTVNSVSVAGSDPTFDSSEVLRAMLGYIKNFFGCRECSKNFQAMAAKSLSAEVKVPAHSILWLWRAHNQVNRRLAGDLTEDPHHPKIQFPSAAACPDCRSASDSWDETRVLTYLKFVYSRAQLSLTGSPVSATTKPHNMSLVNNRQSRVKTKLEEEFRRAWKKKRYRNKKKPDSNAVILRESASAIFDDPKHSSKVLPSVVEVSSWGFSVTDISLCVVLYFISGTILILVYVRFIVKRRYKKKPYVYDILGKV